MSTGFARNSLEEAAGIELAYSRERHRQYDWTNECAFCIQTVATTRLRHTIQNEADELK